MAINPNTQYPGKIATPDANYPYGGAQNITAPSDGTGTPWEKALVNDIFGMQQALLKSAGIVPSGAADKVGASQYLQSLVEIASGRAFNYDDVSTVADTILLSPKINQEPIKSLFIGLKVVFVAAFSNTTGVSINVASTGLTIIRNATTGSLLVPGDIVAGITYTIKYNGVSFTLEDTKKAKNILITDTGGYYSASDIEAALQELRPQVGTWTPNFEGSTVAGTGWVFDVTQGTYVRIGKMILLNFSVRATTVSGTATGDIRISGIPFNLHVTGVKPTGVVSLVRDLTLDHAGDYHYLSAIQNDATTLRIEQTTGVLFKPVSISDMGSLPGIQGSIVAQLV